VANVANDRRVGISTVTDSLNVLFKWAGPGKCICAF